MKNIFVFYLLIQSVSAWAQIPANDPTWIAKKEDQFNSFDANFWIKGYPWDPYWSQYDSTYSDPNFVTFSNGWLKQKVDSVAPFTYTGNNGVTKTFKYKGATMWSQMDSTFKYGYFEVSAKLPLGYGYWPAFWLWGAGGGTLDSNCASTTWVSEMDISESNGLESANKYIFNNHFHWWDPAYCNNFVDVFPTINISPATDTSEHRYALEWSPTRYTYYFDDNILRTSDEVPNIIVGTNPVRIIINHAIDDRPGFAPGTSGSTTFPNYFSLNWLKIWQLKTACTTAETFCTIAFNASTYNYAVKQSITLGGGSCTSSIINTSSNVALWATDFILLGEGTTINPDGTGVFTAKTTVCPN